MLVNNNNTIEPFDTRCKLYCSYIILFIILTILVSVCERGLSVNIHSEYMRQNNSAGIEETFKLDYDSNHQILLNELQKKDICSLYYWINDVLFWSNTVPFLLYIIVNIIIGMFMWCYYFDYFIKSTIIIHFIYYVGIFITKCYYMFVFESINTECNRSSILLIIIINIERILLSMSGIYILTITCFFFSNFFLIH